MRKTCEPKTPILALLVAALLIGQVYAVACLTRGRSESQTTSLHSEAVAGQLVRAHGERKERW